jgi:hypothetical protein
MLRGFTVAAAAEGVLLAPVVTEEHLCLVARFTRQAESIRVGWTAGGLSQAVEVPLPRSQLRSALSWDARL